MEEKTPDQTTDNDASKYTDPSMEYLVQYAQKFERLPPSFCQSKVMPTLGWLERTFLF